MPRRKRERDDAALKPVPAEILDEFVADGLLTAPPCPVCLSGHDRQSCIADLGAVCGLVLGIILGSALLNLGIFAVA